VINEEQHPDFLVYVVGFDILFDDNFIAKKIGFSLGVGPVIIDYPTLRVSPESGSNTTIP
jgi:hypothetical protein